MSERKKFLIAILASIGVHLLLAVLFCIVALLIPGKTLASLTPPPSSKPLQVTLMRKPKPSPTPKLLAEQPLQTPLPSQPARPTPTPVTEQRRVVLSSDGITAAATPPKNTKTESDINSEFRSEKAGEKKSDLPSQEGRALNFTQFENKSVVLAPASTPVPQRTPEAISRVTEDAPQNFYRPTPVPNKQKEPPKKSRKQSNELVLAKNVTPAPAAAPSATPAPAISRVTPPAANTATPPAPAVLRHETIKTKIEGSGGPTGQASIAAVGTPRGRYLKTVYDAIASRWYYHVQRRTDLMMVGEVLIEFWVSEDGHIQNARILSNTANETFGSYCFQSVMEAQVPPIPSDLAAMLPNRRMRITQRFNLTPGQ